MADPAYEEGLIQLDLLPMAHATKILFERVNDDNDDDDVRQSDRFVV